MASPPFMFPLKHKGASLFIISTFCSHLFYFICIYNNKKWQSTFYSHPVWKRHSAPVVCAIPSILSMLTLELGFWDACGLWAESAVCGRSQLSEEALTRCSEHLIVLWAWHKCTVTETNNNLFALQLANTHTHTHTHTPSTTYIASELILFLTCLNRDPWGCTQTLTLRHRRLYTWTLVRVEEEEPCGEARADFSKRWEAGTWAKIKSLQGCCRGIEKRLVFLCLNTRTATHLGSIIMVYFLLSFEWLCAALQR